MTLRRRMMLHAAATIAGVAALCAGTALGIGGLRQDFGTALQANRQLRRVYEVGLHVASARRWVSAEHRRPDLAHEELRRALFALDRPTPGGDVGTAPAAADPTTHSDWLPTSAGGIGRVREAVERAAGQVRRREPAPALDEALAALADLSSETRVAIVTMQASADSKHRATLAAALCLSAATICGAAWVGRRTYRAVADPLHRLGGAVRRIAAGGRDERVPAAGDAEFAALARDFNVMAAELERLCDDLERRVADKSRELIRSERLASVGFLAAGVAHEINNPLGIIAGYGERSLRQLRRGFDPAAAARVEQAIGVMCEEAFRCRGITDRLLALARPGEEGCGVVSLAEVVRQVVSNVATLPCAAGRAVTLETGCGADDEGARDALCVVGSGPRITQVVLNLLVNALDATTPGEGQVRITVRGDGSHVELRVSDNGRGMPPEVLDRVFEPFYSERADQGSEGQGPGTGLGLCISQAIVREHGGTISAHSAGRGQGSCFVVRLPAAREGLGVAR